MDLTQSGEQGEITAIQEGGNDLGERGEGVQSESIAVQEGYGKGQGSVKQRKTRVSSRLGASPASGSRVTTSSVQGDPKKLSRIVKSRRDLKQELARLQFEESQMKEQRKSNVDRHTRSQITAEQIKAIHKALGARKHFEQVCDKKNELLQKSIRERQIEEEEERLEGLEEQKMIKKEEANQHLSELKEKQAERYRIIMERNKKYQELKKQKCAHDKIEENWQSIRKRRKQQQKSIIHQIEESRALSHEEIANHEKKYLKERSKEKQEKQKMLRLEKISKTKIEKATLSQYQPSRFLRTIFEEEENKKKIEQTEKFQSRTYSLKKTQYSQSIRKFNETNWKNHQLKPIKEEVKKGKEKAVSKKNPHPQRAQSKSQFEIMKIGNDYMRQIHSSIGLMDIQKSQAKQINVDSPQKYEDYLTKMRLSRASQQQIQNPEIQEIKQFKSIMKKEGSKDQKFYQVKILANKLDGKVQIDPKMMLASINAKIQMINQLVQN